MNFTTTKPPVKYNQQRSLKRALNLNIALIVLAIASVILRALTPLAEDAAMTNLDIAFKAFLMMAVGVIVSVMVEVFYAISEGTIQKFEVYKRWIDPINTGLLIALLLPSTTPIYALVISVIVGVYAGKLVFGGYGYYIFNPVLVAVLFAHLTFGGQMDITGTPLLLMKEAVFGSSVELSLQSLLIGNYTAVAIGSTSVLLLFAVFVYLCVTKVIDLRISITYLLTIFLVSLGIGFINFTTQGMLIYTLVNMITGLTMFGAVFLVSESVSSPTSRETKIAYAVIVGILVMLIRVLSAEPEGVVFAILFGNLLTPFMNRTVKRSQTKGLIKTVVISIVAIVIVSGAIGFIVQSRIIENLNETAALFGGIL
ncbi:MAG: RnfABCDGE type electron transport complex subunit D [Candidatus Izimaplasma sp.]|nr:RnfABCDGE type electron transport complex subunit D [Candidatus Izimaplasma bacterium]